MLLISQEDYKKDLIKLEKALETKVFHSAYKKRIQTEQQKVNNISGAQFPLPEAIREQISRKVTLKAFTDIPEILSF